VGLAAAEPVTGTQVPRQFMACVPQLSVQFVNTFDGASNWGVGRGIGVTTPAPSGGSGDCIADESGATPVRPGFDGGGRGVCCWASALTDSNANPIATIADSRRMFIVLLPYVGAAIKDLRIRAPCIVRRQAVATIFGPAMLLIFIKRSARRS